MNRKERSRLPIDYFGKRKIAATVFLLGAMGSSAYATSEAFWQACSAAGSYSSSQVPVVRHAQGGQGARMPAELDSENGAAIEEARIAVGNQQLLATLGHGALALSATIAFTRAAYRPTPEEQPLHEFRTSLT